MRVILKEGFVIEQVEDLSYIKDENGRFYAYICFEFKEIGLYPSQESFPFTNEVSEVGTEKQRIESMFTNPLKPTQAECDMVKMVWDLTVPWEEIIWE